jgi:hypothetical protein
MRHVVTTLFILAGLVNLLPVTGVLGAERLESLYGLPVAGDDLLLLLRHRAAMFGVVGGLIIFAAFRVHLRAAATVAGLVSMAAFMLLALPLSAHGEPLQRVFWADVIASALLVAGYGISVRRSRPAAD